MKIKVNDTVLVTTGKYKGKTGKVMRVFKNGRLTVEKVNMRTRHIKKTASGAGQKITYEAPIDASNVMLVASDGKPTKIGYKKEGGKKVRVEKRTGKTIEDVAKSKKKS